MVQKYSPVLRVLHWIIGLLMMGLVLMGFLMTSVFPEPFRFSFYGIHKSLGITVLGLAILRIAIRLTTDRIPSVPSVVSMPERFISRLVYLAFYGVMLAMPISGYMMSVAGGHPVEWFGVPVISLFEKNQDIGQMAHTVHEMVGYALLVLLILHIGGVIMHWKRDRVNLLKRMW